MVLTIPVYDPIARMSDATPGGINHPAGSGAIRLACRVLTRYGEVVIDFNDFDDLLGYSDQLSVEGAAASWTIRMRASTCNEELLKKIHPGYVIEVYAARNDDPLIGVVKDPSSIQRIDTTPDLSVIRPPEVPANPVAAGQGFDGGVGAISGSQSSELTPRQRAFLDVIAYAEGTSGPDGYTTMFSGRQFESFADHPRIVISAGGYHSSASGRYQILEDTYDDFAPQLGITDFSPASQDRIAIALLQRRNALDAVNAGNFEEAIRRTNREWASLPGSPYGQPTKTMAELRRVYDERLAAYGAAGAADTAASVITPPPTVPTQVSSQQTQRYSTTLAAQRYGASRSGGRRRHSGVDLDITGPDATAISFIGGVVTRVAYDAGGYWDYLDIYNAQLNVVERIAEYRTPAGFKVGDVIAPGQSVGRGEIACGRGGSCGVFHYEIRNDVNANKQGGFDFDGTTDPIAFLRGQGVDPYAEPSQVFANARIQPSAGPLSTVPSVGTGGVPAIAVPVVDIEGAVVEPVNDYYLDNCPHLLMHGIVTDYGRTTSGTETHLTISGEGYGKVYKDSFILLDRNAPSTLGQALEVRTMAEVQTAVSYIYYQILRNWVESFWGSPTGWEARTRPIPLPPNYLTRISEGSAWSALQTLSIDGFFHIFVDHTGAIVWEKLPWSSREQSLITGRTWEDLPSLELPSWKIVSWSDRLSGQGLANFLRITPTASAGSGGQDAANGLAAMIYNIGSIRQYGGPIKRELFVPFGTSGGQWYTTAPRRQAEATFNSFADLCVLEGARWFDRPVQRCSVTVRGESAWRIHTRVRLAENWHCPDARPAWYYVSSRSHNIDVASGSWTTSLEMTRDRRNRYLGIGVGELPLIFDQINPTRGNQDAIGSAQFTGAEDFSFANIRLSPLTTIDATAPDAEGAIATTRVTSIEVPLVPDEYFFFDRKQGKVVNIGNDPLAWANENVVPLLGVEETPTTTNAPSAATDAVPPTTGGTQPEVATVQAPQFETDTPPGSYTFALERDGQRVTEVPSPINGTVVRSERIDDYGNVVEVRGSDGRSYFLGHLDTRGVQRGQRVQRGQTIGLQGNSGYAQNPHLIMQIRESARGRSQVIGDRSITRPLVEQYLEFVQGGR